LKIAPAG